MVCVWTNLILKYKVVEWCEKILNDYILYDEMITDYIMMIQMGFRFRNQCSMHRFPSEVRKTIHEAILNNTSCDGH
jgi:hypothetical protein